MPVQEFLKNFSYGQIPKAKSGQKEDIEALVYDNIVHAQNDIKYSIKSAMGSPATLLNSSGQTNFKYRIFGMTDALVFIIVVILSAFDFWFVKNVSGRILVGLRWWNEVQEDGSEKWVFESSDEKRESSIDTTIFWGSTYLAPIFWAVFVFLELISFSLMWFLLCLIAFILTGSNAYLYIKCSKKVY